MTYFIFRKTDTSKGLSVYHNVLWDFYRDEDKNNKKSITKYSNYLFYKLHFTIVFNHQMRTFRGLCGLNADHIYAKRSACGPSPQNVDQFGNSALDSIIPVI